MGKQKQRYYLLSFLLLLGASGEVSADAVSDINSIRLLAGLPQLSHSAALEKAALAHANYLNRYMVPGAGPVSAHEQRASLPGFTGHQASDRAKHAGYAHTHIIENVSLGNQTAEESVSSLMSAIYHRFAFLDMQIDEIGAAQVGLSYVYEMGRRDLAQACSARAVEARVFAPFNCLGQKMKHSSYLDLCTDLPEQALYKDPFPARCSNGGLLQKSFMEEVCEAPPAGAVLKGAGRYYQACSNGLKISAAWFDQVCQSTNPDIQYQHSGDSYQICSPAVKINADWYQNFCARLPEGKLDNDSGAYYQICNNDFKIKSEYFDRLKSDTLLMRPDAILWPAEGATEIQPVFYDEDPHPTPDLPFTGYPISIEFNAAMVKRVTIMGFMLEQRNPGLVAAWRPLPQVRMIDHLNDINGKLSPLQFAWFPLQRLQWGTRYRYRIDALVDGVLRHYSAAFKTTEFNLPLYQVSADTRELSVAENRFVLYRKPDAYDTSPFKDVSLKYRRRPYVNINILDSNTIELEAGGSSCEPIILSTRLEREIEINFCNNTVWRSLFQ